MLFLNVSTARTEIALATTEPWTAIDVDKPMSDLTSLLDAWTKRAGSRMLSISFPDDPIVIAAIIERHAHQLQALKMYRDSGDIALVAAAGPFPLLKTLTPDTQETMDLFRVCSNIVECTLDDVFTMRIHTQKKIWFFRAYGT
ncbi:hypothetical protein B0H17DRAFT_1206806 [Mycena rosella]|uniref:Uncharacterized protein n=1 Tax=Mycena rosella TaxID=1033263 RepID=A0AAD7G8Q8_MYCRO|nr:hypothetical protein B0H17DRAFT_1206806 [Mycena rosella]